MNATHKSLSGGHLQNKAWELQALHPHKKRKFRPRVLANITTTSANGNETREEPDAAENSAPGEQDPSPDLQRIRPR
jgi:hypothetical protein